VSRSRSGVGDVGFVGASVLSVKPDSADAVSDLVWVRIIKKNFRHPLRTPNKRFQRIDALKSEQPIRSLCEALEVSSSG